MNSHDQPETIQVPYGGQMVDAERVNFDVLERSVLRLRVREAAHEVALITHLIQLWRLKDRTDAAGRPIYLTQSANTLEVYDVEES